MADEQTSIGDWCAGGAGDEGSGTADGGAAGGGGSGGGRDAGVDPAADALPRAFRRLPERVPERVLSALPAPEETGESGSPFLDPEALGAFVRHERCPQQFQYRSLRTEPRSGRESRSVYQNLHLEAFTQVRPIHLQSGAEFERAVVDFIANESGGRVRLETPATVAAALDGGAGGTPGGGGPAADGGRQVPERREADGTAGGAVDPGAGASGPTGGTGGTAGCGAGGGAGGDPDDPDDPDDPGGPGAPGESGGGGAGVPDGDDALGVDAARRHLIRTIAALHGRPDATPVAYDQLPVGGVLGAWPLAGRADVVFVAGTETGVRLHVVDIKSAREEKPHHRVQVAVYTSLLREWLAAVGPPRGVEARVTGGVVHRDTDLEALPDDWGVDDLPAFELRPVEFDVRALVAPDGRLAEVAATPPDEVEYRISEKCSGCLYNEECHAHSIEEGRLSLLGLSESARRRLAAAGVDDLHDLAALGEPPARQFADGGGDGGGGPVPFARETFALDADEMDAVRAAAAHDDLATDLYGVVQRAQAALGRLDPGDEAAFRPDRTYWRPGTGDCGVPDETAPGAPDTLVRVYLHVERDHPSDRVAMLSARVAATSAPDGTARSLSSLVGDAPPGHRDHDAPWHRARERAAEYEVREADLLDRFLNGDPGTDRAAGHDGLFDAVAAVAAAGREGGDAGGGGGDGGDGGADGDVGVHFYTYTDTELDALDDALATHDGAVPGARALRDLLGLRGAMGRPEDQPMVSVVQEEVEDHINLPTPNRGLLPVHDELYPETARAEDRVDYADLERETPAGETVDLREVFAFRFFNYAQPADREGGVLSLRYGGGDAGGGGGGDGGGDGNGSGGGAEDPPDDYYPVRFRDGAQIPLEYVWGAIGREFDAPVDDGRHLYRRRRYLYRTDDPTDPDGDRTVAEVHDRIERADVRAMGACAAEMLAHVEGGLVFRDRQVAREKRPLVPDALPGFDLGAPALPPAERDYLRGEVAAGEEACRELYDFRVWQRPLTGRSAVVAVESVERVGDGGGDGAGGGEGGTPGSDNRPPFRVECRMPYDALDAVYEADPTDLARRCRFKERADGGSGSYVVANRLRRESTAPAPPGPAWDGGGPAPGTPAHAERGPLAEVVSVDPAADPPRLVFEAKPPFFPGGDDDRAAPDFHTHRRRWTGPGGGHDDAWAVPVEAGDWFVLDEAASGVVAGAAVDLLERGNVFLDTLGAAGRGEDVGTARPDWAPGAAAFADDLGAVPGVPDGLPNDSQRAFVEATGDRLVVVQGPPGTGKTGGTLAPGVLARVRAAVRRGERPVVAVVAPSNQALDEAFAATADLAATVADAPPDATGAGGHHPAAGLESVPLVRLTGDPGDGPVARGGSVAGYGGDGAGANGPDVLHDVAPDDLYDHTVRTVRAAATGGGQARPGGGGVGAGGGAGAADAADAAGAGGGGARPPAEWGAGVVVFGTAFGLRRLLDDVAGGDDDAVDALRAGERYFDVVVADEASMLSVPSAGVPGAFLRADGQFVGVGDHRQMPPVNEHEWADERRRPTAATAPHVSVLDRMRLADADEAAAMRAAGEDDRLGVDFDRLAFPSAGDVRFVRLEVSLRCRPAVAEFLAESVYAADGIPFRSGGPARDRAIDGAAPLGGGPVPDAVGAADDLGGVLAAADDPQVVFVELDEARGQQSNPAEAAVVDAVARAVDDGHSTGAVVPHNAQRSLVAARTPPSVDVDTVERFQGGERDVVAVSATVADPDYLARSADFALDPRRLTVSMSRMRRLLVIVASRSVLETVPRDLATYERAAIWKRLHRFVGGGGRPDWSGTVGDLVADPDAPRAHVGADVYVVSGGD